jgi:uncharacterized protein (TIGR02118 family)
MIVCSIVYPNRPDARFDFEYYFGKHIPLVTGVLSAHPGYRGTRVEKGLAGSPPGTPAAYLLMCHCAFDTIENYRAALAPRADDIRSDVANYTNVVPAVQFSEVVVEQ